ncbi:MAG: acetate--CoA ligase, partial [Sandaracinaceae bacterium]|nr:acetate--CoA ligase [Sandaracinaceae bacterium]
TASTPRRRAPRSRPKRADVLLNVNDTCVDRHAKERPDTVAILWEGDEPGDVRRITYRELHREVSKAANALAELGLKSGERAILYMGMVPEAAIAMLACARLGAVHSVVFGGFSAEALRDRIRDCGAEIVITQDEGLRGSKKIPLKAVADEACHGTPSVKKMLVLRRTGGAVSWTEDRDVWWHDAVGAASESHEAVPVEAEHPLFILYTSGSTGRPKGVVHTTGGYLTYVSYTHETVFDVREDDIYACVADVGWVTGHSYIVYGPLANGATTLMFESIPTYPDAGRYWDMVARHKITIFYTAPTALRALAAQGDGFVKPHERSSLRVLGTVGEPINPEAWKWYFDVVGQGRCNVVDTWWQTETGGIAISPIAPATPTKPGSATLPMPGIVPSLRTPEGRLIRGPGQGLLCLDHPWPGQARTVWGDHDRFVATYFAHVEGVYFTGDGCRRDEDGYYWITGRVDDVLNVSGHRMGTAEFESAIVSVEEVAEAAVVGYPHPLKGQGVYAYVVPQPGETVDDAALNRACREQIGAHAKIDRVQVVPGLPKTRSGKVMRRILRKIAEGEGDSLGDVSTLADPSVVEKIREGFRTE